MRGKLSPAPSRISTCRITPADAGKTCHTELLSAIFRDHPRGCGENPVIIDELQLSDGITPADAGKTVTYLHDVESAKDHPRGCGENISTDCVQIAMTGSPPRMRGKRLDL